MDNRKSFDARLTAARPEVAAKYLEGKVDAARFVDGDDFAIADAVVPLHASPSADAMLETQALKGDRVIIYDRNGEGWVWGQLRSDGYVGWLPERALTRSTALPTHKVMALRTFAFPGRSIKLPPRDTLPLGAMVTVTRHDAEFAITDDGLFLPARHLGELDERESDFVAVAERFIGTPYLWGGKTSLGIDCSGLVQIALTAAGTGCPRDSDMQEAGLGRPLSPSEMRRLQRGDLIFWKGHVAIARDTDSIVHANAHHMATVIEKTHDAVARIKAAGSDVISIKRMM